MQLISDSFAEKILIRRQKRVGKKDLSKIIKRNFKLKSTFSKCIQLSDYFDDFMLFLSLLNDYLHGRYKTVPWSVISSIAATLLYVLMILDIIPDFIPVIGFIDDATIFAFCLKTIRSELEKYKQWHNEWLFKYNTTQ